MGLRELITGGSKEGHPDGSVTERFSSGESVTRNADGSIRESTSHEISWNGLGTPITVTRNGAEETINVQDGWGKEK